MVDQEPRQFQEGDPNPPESVPIPDELHRNPLTQRLTRVVEIKGKEDRDATKKALKGGRISEPMLLDIYGGVETTLGTRKVRSKHEKSKKTRKKKNI